MSTASTLLGLDIDEDDISDDYDFAESDDEAQEGRRAARQQHEPQAKYMDLLQKVSNRLEDEITIELDDLAEVCTRLIFLFLVCSQLLV